MLSAIIKALITGLLFSAAYILWYWFASGYQLECFNVLDTGPVCPLATNWSWYTVCGARAALICATLFATVCLWANDYD